jgi:hypothetical protein
MILSIGGKVLFVALIVMAVLFGTSPLVSPIESVRNFIKNTGNIKANTKNNSGK